MNMHNMVYLIGRLTKNVEMEDDNKAIINIACQRAFKNEEGIYETDFFNVELYSGIAKNTAEYCAKGDLVGIKGALRNDKNGNTYVIAEKISFLASKRADSETEEEEE